MNTKYISIMSLAVAAGLMVSQSASAVTMSSLNETIGVGKTLSVGLNQISSETWSVTGNSNAAVADVTVNGSSAVIKGKAAGSTTVSVCSSAGSQCLQINVTVSGVLGASITMAHTAGSWVKDGATIFYVSKSGLIPVPTWAIFLSNKGKPSKVVSINDGDKQLPMLSLMVKKDSRVK